MSARPFLTRWRPLATACCCGAALLMSAPARAERAWPQLALPADAQAWSVGEQFSANGVPLRVRGFLSPRPLDALVREMRQQLGEPVVHSRVGNKVILGRAEAGFYLTLQLEPVAGGTRALLAVADLETARRQRPATQAFTQRWLQRLPAGSQILSHSSARDGALRSTQLVYRNGASAALNSQALAAVLAQDGLEPARDADTGGDRVLLFKGPGQEASAVIVRLPDGQSSVVLNTVSASRGDAEDRP
jgi:hypothetical protein